ncbi:MAG: hypothetical protein KJ936_06840, partial [Proteobacteria bacterium]|nr:hypothetical protein [Pseudomonadota bacterium]
PWDYHNQSKGLDDNGWPLCRFGCGWVADGCVVVQPVHRRFVPLRGEMPVNVHRYLTPYRVGHY